ncbi:MAG: helix-hairpin-helix domain-containing protein [Coprococcus sp.]
MKLNKKIVSGQCMILIMIFVMLMLCGCGKETLVLNEDKDIPGDVSGDVLQDDIADDESGTEEADNQYDVNQESVVDDISGSFEDVVTVFVCGAVKNEGVYELPADSRVEDALKAAGGFAEAADTAAVNRADNIYDGQRIYFPYEGEELTQQQFLQEDDNTLIDINHADKETLMTLPGIGETKAEHIIEYREKYGSFEYIEDIKNVNGIGDSIYQKIEEYITVGK